MKLQLAIGRANTLSLGSLPGRETFSASDFKDPTRVKGAIKLADARNELFRVIKVGVRFWPFLLVARDTSEKSPLDIEKELRRIQRTQKKLSGQPGRSIGPKKRATFRAYQSMYSSIQNSGEPSVEVLKGFLSDRRRRYVGDPATFTRNRSSATWKKLLVSSMGRPAKQFAKLLRREEKRRAVKGGSWIDVIERAITTVLKDRRKQYDPKLWKGAACYAFLRCMYGIEEFEGGIHPHQKTADWAKTLQTELRQATSEEAEPFKRYLAAIRQAESRPPWRSTHKRLKQENRRVLESLRFFTFYNLYCRPVPDGRWLKRER